MSPETSSHAERETDVLDQIVIDTPILGIMGPPGNGKSVAINIVEDASNRTEIGDALGLGRPLNVGVARKSTTRPNRGADDRFKKSGLPNEAFDDPLMIGKYVLSNNGALYGYHADDLQAPEGTDVMVGEPSLHHIRELKDRISGQLHNVFLASDRDYRFARLGGRGTEDPVEVRKRVLEGDAQTILVDMLGADLNASPEDLTDPEMVVLFRAVRNANDADELQRAVTALEKYLAGFAGVTGEAAKKYAMPTAKLYAEDIRHVGAGEAPVDHIIVLDDTFLSKEPIRSGKYRDQVLDQVRGLFNNRD
ncbi:MAG: hypothetical protein KBC95_04430 [Candidatus Peribacteraceae bacterium]|nr:hypothetical protein [Candidatus Peribacteraceae bacterium]